MKRAVVCMVAFRAGKGLGCVLRCGVRMDEGEWRRMSYKLFSFESEV